LAKTQKCSRPLCVHPFFSFLYKEKKEKINSTSVTYLFFTPKKSQFFQLSSPFLPLKKFDSKSKKQKNGFLLNLLTEHTADIYHSCPTPLITAKQNTPQGFSELLFLVF